MSKPFFENLSLNEACKEQHRRVRAKGFEQQNIPTLLMLVVSELGEAVEAHRKHRWTNLPDDPTDTVFDPRTFHTDNVYFKLVFEEHVKDTFEDEIADAFLRLMGLCGEYEIDIEKHIRMKAEYNELRPPKHGKAY